MATTDLNVLPYEITAVYTHPDAKVDIVLVHGLNGHPRRTWTAKENNMFWPAELLPNTLGLPPANILVYGYNSAVFGKPADNVMLNHAQTLVTVLTSHRQEHGTSRNPIIWIAHSLGGILTKRALLYSKDVNNAHRQHLRSIFVSTFAIVFLGTPHNGSSLASIGLNIQTLGSRLLPKFIFESEPILLKTLYRDSETLKEISNQFLEIYHLFKIHMAYEMQKTDLIVTKSLIVNNESACPQLPSATYYGIQATHSGMCKFSSNTAPGYRVMTRSIREWVRDAPGAIQARWSGETAENAQQKRLGWEEALPMADSFGMGHFPESSFSTAAVKEVEMPLASSDAETNTPHQATVSSDVATLVSPAVSDTGEAASSPIAIPALQSAAPALPRPAQTSDSPIDRPAPFFVVPEKFRPNSYFVGRDEELTELHTLLNDPERTSEGTSAVVIHSLPGGGKTHLAREYVFRHRHDYPGGVYWVQAESIPKMEQFYQVIAMNGLLRELDGRSTPSEETDEPNDIVDRVCRWFRGRDHWLLVFDGIRFSNPGIERFIPDARNTSIIYTSTMSSASGDHRFDNPRLLRLKLLPPKHAQELLFKELERPNPSKEDEQMALELVKDLGYLPLMVHAAARQLMATQEPLAKYLRTLRIRSRIRPAELPAYVAVYDQLMAEGAKPALRLMFILAHFDSRMPMGFLNMGLQVLNDNAVSTFDDIYVTFSFTTTLKTLMSFALLERTEADAVSKSSSWDKRTDKMPDFVDVLLIHRVVQLFFVNVLHEAKQCDLWMECSAVVYCCAFDNAKMFINVAWDDKDFRVGTLDDYQSFKIHGDRLMDHLRARMDRRSSSRIKLEQPAQHVLERIGYCEDAIWRMSKDTQQPIVNGRRPMSVFEYAGYLANNTMEVSNPYDNTANRYSFTDHDDVNFFQYKESYPWQPDPDRADEDCEKKSQPSLEPCDASGISNQSPVPATSATVSQLPRSHLDVRRLSGGPTGHTYHDAQNQDSHDNMDAATACTPAPTEMYQPGPEAPLHDQHPQRAETHHRTVRKLKDRRYRDSFGSWRQMGAADPRVHGTSVTGTVIKPRAGMSGGLLSYPGGMTEAQKSLQAVLRTTGSSGPVSKSDLLEDAVGGGQAQNNSIQASASQQKRRRTDSVGSLCSSTLKHMGGFFDSKPASGQPHQRDPGSAGPPDQALDDSSDDEISDEPGDLDQFRSQTKNLLGRSMTARPSPGPGNGLYPPPPYPDQDTMPPSWGRLPLWPAEGRNFGRAQSEFPDRADTAERTTPWLSDVPHMASSFPPPKPSGHPQPFMLRDDNDPHPRAPVAYGYSSQPMSRNVSSQSQPGRAVPPRLVVPAGTGDPLPCRPGSGRQQSLSVSTGEQQQAASRAPPGQRRCSRSSIVETEPSPMQNYLMFDEETSREHEAQWLRREQQKLFEDRRLWNYWNGFEEAAGSSAAARSLRPPTENSTAVSHAPTDARPLLSEARSSSDGVLALSGGVVAGGAWTDRDPPSAARYYPTQSSNTNTFGTQPTAVAMSRSRSGSARSRQPSHVPRSVLGGGYSAEPIPRDFSGGSYGSAQARSGGAYNGRRAMQPRDEGR